MGLSAKAAAWGSVPKAIAKAKAKRNARRTRAL
jgi:hypothetical protein